MWKWAAAVAFLLLVGVLWTTRGSGTARAPRVQTQNAAPAQAEPAAPSAPAAVTPGDEAPPPVVARGVVVDEEDHPIAGALVRWRRSLESEGVPEAHTADDGTFAMTLTARAEGAYIVEARGYAGRTVEAEGLPSPQRIVLRRGSLRVRARVVDEEQRPVHGATGEVFLDEGYGRAVTDFRGVLEVTDLALYSFDTNEHIAVLLVRAEGYVPSAVPLAAPDDAGTVVLSRGGVVRGVVRDEGTGRPAAGACIACVSSALLSDDCKGRSGADGSFQLEAVPLDTIWLYAYAEGYLPGRQGWSPSLAGRFGESIFPEEQREIARDLMVVRSVTVRGVVLNEIGVPVGQAPVSVEEEQHGQSPRGLVPGLVSRATTDAKGTFAVAGFYPGTVLTIEAQSESGVARLETRAGEDRVTLRLEPTCRVIGRVVDADRRPVLEAELSIEGPADEGEEARKARAPLNSWATSDAEGRFAFSHVRPGPWQLRVEARGLVSLETAIEIRPGPREIDLGDIILGSGGFIAGQVVDAAGQPLRGVRIHARSSEERAGGEKNYGSVTTDGEGRFRIGGLHDGEFVVEAGKRGWYSDEITVTSGRADLRFVMLETVTASGRVLGGGRPLAEVNVVASGGHAEPWETGPDGTFKVTDLRPGRPFQLALSHALYKTLSLPKIEPWEGVRDFALAEGRMFEGTVVDERGRPLPDMSVEAHTAGHDDRRMTKSDAQGRWRVGGLEEGPTIVDFGVNLGYAFEEPVEVAAGVGSYQLVGRKGYEIRGSVRRKEGKPPEDAAVTVYRADGSEVSAGFSWEGQYARFSTIELPAGRYKLVVSGYSRGPHGALKEHYGETTLEVTIPGPDVEVVLPK